jgi:hypothetical protein
MAYIFDGLKDSYRFPLADAAVLRCMEAGSFVGKISLTAAVCLLLRREPKLINLRYAKFR